jgi:hypothetical protein
MHALLPKKMIPFADAEKVEDTFLRARSLTEEWLFVLWGLLVFRTSFV